MKENQIKCVLKLTFVRNIDPNVCLPTQNRAFIHHSFPKCVLTIRYVLGPQLVLGVQRCIEGDTVPMLFGADGAVPMLFGAGGGRQ